MNDVNLMGNLGADPEVRYTSTGKPVCSLRVATNEAFTDAQGNKQNRTEWHRVVVWNKQAESCGQYLKKGRQVLVKGRLQTHRWEDKDGNKHWTTEVVARNVTFLGGNPQQTEDQQTEDPNQMELPLDPQEEEKVVNPQLNPKDMVF